MSHLPFAVMPRSSVMAVVCLQFVSIAAQQAFPVIVSGNARGLVVGRLGAFMRHFEEEQVGELLDVVTIRHAVVAQDVAVVPEFLDDVLRVGGHEWAPLMVCRL